MFDRVIWGVFFADSWQRRMMVTAPQSASDVAQENVVQPRCRGLGFLFCCPKVLVFWGGRGGAGTKLCACFGVVRVFLFNVASSRPTTLNRKTRLKHKSRGLGFRFGVWGLRFEGEGFQVF